MATCIIHIGTEKSGTTSLQHWLYLNELALSRCGVALTRSANSPNNRKLVTYIQGGIDDFLAQRGIVDEAERAHFFSGFEETLTREIERQLTHHDTVLLTSEHFHSRLRTLEQIARLKTLLDRFFSSYKIVCYFREQSRLRISSYSTSLKGRGTKPLEARELPQVEGNHYFNHLYSFQKWETVFGRACLAPRIFQADQWLGQALESDFLAVALPQVPIAMMKHRPSNLNVSLNQTVAGMFRTINQVRPKFTDRSIDPTHVLFKRVVTSLDNFSHHPAIHDPHQTEMYRRFNACNLEFFQRYFGVRQNLFQPPVPNPRYEPVQLHQSDLESLLTGLLSRDGLIAVKAEEVDLLARLASELHANDAIGMSDALQLAQIAQRARPKCERLKYQVNQLAKTNLFEPKRDRIGDRLRRLPAALVRRLRLKLRP